MTQSVMSDGDLNQKPLHQKTSCHWFLAQFLCNLTSNYLKHFSLFPFLKNGASVNSRWVDWSLCIVCVIFKDADKAEVCDDIPCCISFYRQICKDTLWKKSKISYISQGANSLWVSLICVRVTCIVVMCIKWKQEYLSLTTLFCQALNT